MASNASIVLQRFRDRKILCVREVSGVWSLPGGRIERGELPFHAAKREFYEETGNVLPDLRIEGRNFDHYERRHRNGSSTLLYVGITNSPDLNFRYHHKNHETNGLAYFSYEDIVSGHIPFHRYIVRSLRLLREKYAI